MQQEQRHATKATTGRVFLVSEILKDLRNEKLQSQEEMAFACSDQKIRVSIASIKRAETGHPVIYRVARELARYFNVPVQTLIRSDPALTRIPPDRSVESRP